VALAPAGLTQNLPQFKIMSRLLVAGVVSSAAVVLGRCSLAGPVTVPNGSFESPTTSFVSVNLDSWQKAPKPDWYVESGGFLRTQLTGLFKNTATNSPDHIDNCDGDQALWLFVVPEVSLFQDYDSVDWNDSVPSHALNATYEAGKSYQLTVGVIGTAGGMQQGATLELSLYYRDAASNRVAVAVTSITNTTALFTNATHFLDFNVSVPTVKADDAWAGQHIGIQLLSTVTTNLQGGYWDLDHVRLAALQELVLLDPVSTNGQFQFTLKSEPGLEIEILSTTNVALPMSEWASAGIVINTSGSMVFTETASEAGRFYRARQRLQ
jgi:hypothetical protein